MPSQRPHPPDESPRHPAGEPDFGPGPDTAGPDPGAPGQARLGPLTPPNESPGQRLRQWFSPLGTALLVPLFLIAVVLWSSPNFRLDGDAGHPRPTPFGGDFLQEWIGGWIVRSENSDQLYQRRAFVEQQHRPELVGFSWDGERYYPPIYPPGYYVLVSPLSRLAYPTAAIVWLCLSAAALAATFVLLYRFEPSVRRLYPAVPLASLFFAPLLLNLNIGHKATGLLLIFTATYLLLRHRRPTLSGVVFGFIAFKPHLLVVLTGIAIWKRQWRFLAGLVMTGVGWIGLCWVAGPDQLGEFLQTALGTGNYVQTEGYRLDMAHGLWGVIELSLQGTHDGWIKLVVGVATLAIGALIVRAVHGPWAPHRPGFALQFSAIVLGTVLVSPHFYTYDLVVVLLPLMLTLGHLWRADGVAWPGWIAIAFLLLAGTFQPVAAALSIQISTFLLVAWLIGLGGKTKKALKNGVVLTLDKSALNWHIGYP